MCKSPQFVGPTLPYDWMLEEWAHLAERIILLKLLYYYPERMSKQARRLSTNDEAYDAFERGYLRLCVELGRPNELVHKEYPEYRHVAGVGMMEVDFGRADVLAVLARYGSLT